MLPSLNTLKLPDTWQHQAVTLLREGTDVVVSAPTGAGKTYIFELLHQSRSLKGQAVYTVPTRALANDKYAEWKEAKWNVGIATGDIAENVDAPVVVATLETQIERLVRGEGPALLVIGEVVAIAKAGATDFTHQRMSGSVEGDPHKIGLADALVSVATPPSRGRKDGEPAALLTDLWRMFS